MTEQELIERLALASVEADSLTWGHLTPSQRASRLLKMASALSILREAIPGLDALIAGTGVVVPKEPTEAMLNGARDWAIKKYGIGIGNDAAIGCYRVMIEAAKGE